MMVPVPTVLVLENIKWVHVPKVKPSCGLIKGEECKLVRAFYFIVT